MNLTCQIYKRFDHCYILKKICVKTELLCLLLSAHTSSTLITSSSLRTIFHFVATLPKTIKINCNQCNQGNDIDWGAATLCVYLQHLGKAWGYFGDRIGVEEVNEVLKGMVLWVSQYGLEVVRMREACSLPAFEMVKARKSIVKTRCVRQTTAVSRGRQMARPSKIQNIYQPGQFSIWATEFFCFRFSNILRIRILLYQSQLSEESSEPGKGARLVRRSGRINIASKPTALLHGKR